MQSKLQDGSIILCGTAHKDAVFERNFTTVCEFSLKVSTRLSSAGDFETVWANCRAWEDVGEYASNIRKGDKVLCVGKIGETHIKGKIFKHINCEFVSIMRIENGGIKHD